MATLNSLQQSVTDLTNTTTGLLAAVTVSQSYLDGAVNTVQASTDQVLDDKNSVLSNEIIISNTSDAILPDMTLISSAMLKVRDAHDTVVADWTRVLSEHSEVMVKWGEIQVAPISIDLGIAKNNINTFDALVSSITH